MNAMMALAVAIGLGTAPAAEDPLHTSETWTRPQAAHLLRRAGFGGTPEQIDFLAGLGREGAVDYLVDYAQVADKPLSVRIDPHPKPLRWTHPDLSPQELQKLRQQRRQADRRQFGRIVGWWIKTMVASPRPLQEKLVLFWHGHFTSGYREVRSSRAMYFQNQLFRRRAAGNFRDLLLDVTKDPAMVHYLNTDQNRKGRPNENYAREVMELFTLGPGHYTERDVKEAARALTGIGIDRATGQTVFRGKQHDYLSKMFLGRTGNFDANDIIDIILQQTAAPEFLARKLWTFFAYEDPNEQIVKALAKVLRDNNYELKPLLKAMFSCDAFYSDRAMFTHVKSPVELLVGTLRMLEIKPADTHLMAEGLRALGQQLMQPPNVAGWDGGLRWINTSTLLDRYNFMGRLLEGNDNPLERRRRDRRRKRVLESLGDQAKLADDDFPPLQTAYDPMPLIKSQKLRSGGAVVDYFVNRLLQRPIAPERRRALIDALMPHVNWRNFQSPSNAAGIRGMIHLIMSMPEYQMS